GTGGIAHALSQAARAGAPAHRRHSTDTGARAGLPGLSVSIRKCAARKSAAAGHRLGTGDETELFPVVLDAGCGIARTGWQRRATQTGGADRTSPANDAGPARAPFGH